MKKELREKANKILDEELEQQKVRLKEKLSVLLGNNHSSAQYTRRLDTIFKTLKDKLMYEGNYKKLLRNADFYQKLELFMNYDEEVVEVGNTQKKVITTDIYKLIGEVFLSLYINFILSFLDDESEFPLPYFGRLKIKEIDRFNPFHNKNIHYFYGRIFLDDALRKDLQRIDKEEKLDLIDDALKHTEKILREKMY